LVNRSKANNKQIYLLDIYWRYGCCVFYIFLLSFGEGKTREKINGGGQVFLEVEGGWFLSGSCSRASIIGDCCCLGSYFSNLWGSLSLSLWWKLNCDQRYYHQEVCEKIDLAPLIVHKIMFFWWICYMGLFHLQVILGYRSMSSLLNSSTVLMGLCLSSLMCEVCYGSNFITFEIHEIWWVFGVCFLRVLWKVRFCSYMTWDFFFPFFFW